MRSGFVDLIVKNRLAGKSVVPASLSSKRYQPVDSFKKYITETLPKMEESVEIQILKKNLQKIESASIRKELINAYLRRLFRLKLYERSDIKPYKTIAQISPEQIPTLIDPTILKPINEHTQYDVGSYCLFSNDDLKKVFKHGCYGGYQKKEWAYTKKFGIMIRKQSLAIVSVMKILQESQPVDWSLIYQLQPAERIQYINNEKIYPTLFQELSVYLYKQIKPLKMKEHYNRTWGSSCISDTLVNSVLQNLHQHNDVFAMIDQCIQQVELLSVKPSNLDFLKRYKELPTEPPIKLFDNVPYFCRFSYKTPSFKSLFLGGLAGTGRSMILAYITMFAFKNNWIVISVPNAIDWTQDKDNQPERMYNGLYVVPVHVIKWLDQFKSVNEHLIKTLPVNLAIYGKMDITGVSPDEEFEPCPNLYDERRKTYSREIEEIYKERTLEGNDLRYKYRLTDKLPTPKTILEIIDCGIANPQYATCAMGELLRQIYEIQNIPILECVDSFSWFFRGSHHSSFRYYNDSGLFGQIPPYHIAHCRMFIHLDGHKLKKGLKVVASSNGTLHKHLFDIKKIMYPENYEHMVPNLEPKEFQKAGRYNILTSYWAADDVQRQNISYMYTLCQGNWKDFQRAHELAHYY